MSDALVCILIAGGILGASYLLDRWLERQHARLMESALRKKFEG